MLHVGLLFREKAWRLLQELLEFDFDGIKSFYAYVVRKLRGQIEDLRNVSQCISNP